MTFRLRSWRHALAEACGAQLIMAAMLAAALLIPWDNALVGMTDLLTPAAEATSTSERCS